MQTWKIVLTYDGTPFHGWQIQPGLATIQGTLAEAIRHVTGESVLPQGSGRTDTGVHALAQVATFAIGCAIPAENLHRALNRALPSSIRVVCIEAAAPGFHARHSAVRKTYEYRIFPRLQERGQDVCSPMLAPYVWVCPLLLDLPSLHRAATQIIGTHDFTSFAAVDPDQASRAAGSDTPTHASNVRTIYHSCWRVTDGLYCFRITGSGFLHHMVRNLVGTFVEAGAGRVADDAVTKILAARDRSAAGPTAPARGLFLVEVEY
jgi:tRNA pseudouridine38-40 synthase